VSERTAAKWLARWRAAGEAGLGPQLGTHTVANRTPEARVEAIAALRRLRLTGPEVAELLEIASSPVSAVLDRIGLGKLSRLEPPEPPNRYERANPGELIHIDVKKLVRIERGKRTSQARGAGWERVHVCVDDATRLAYVEVLSDEKSRTAIGFLKRALAFYAAHGKGREGEPTTAGLPLGRPRTCLPGPWGFATSAAALPAAHQRQGGALHPHDPGRLGLRGDLSGLGAADRGATRLAGLL
jgi:hypothetical protein